MGRTGTPVRPRGDGAALERCRGRYGELAFREMRVQPLSSILRLLRGFRGRRILPWRRGMLSEEAGTKRGGGLCRRCRWRRRRSLRLAETVGHSAQEHRTIDVHVVVVMMIRFLEVLKLWRPRIWTLYRCGAGKTTPVMSMRRATARGGGGARLGTGGVWLWGSPFRTIARTSAPVVLGPTSVSFVDSHFVLRWPREVRRGQEVELESRPRVETSVIGERLFARI